MPVQLAWYEHWSEEPGVGDSTPPAGTRPDEVDWQSTRSEQVYYKLPVSLDDTSELNSWRHEARKRIAILQTWGWQ